MAILPSRRAGLEAAAKTIAKNKARYEVVEKLTGGKVPWWAIGLLHMRESSCDFSTFLGNGEPLNRVTTMKPKGLGPWTGSDAWERGAVVALKIDGLDKVDTWNIPTALFFFEKFNGQGYFKEGINSPYNWSGSNLYTSGKFTETPAGSKFNPSLRDLQPGCAPMLQILIATGLIPSLVKEVISMATDATTPAVPVTPKNTATGVTINKSQNLATHIITAVGAVLAALGLSQAHSLYDVVTSSNLLGGVVVAGLAMLISHFNVNGANDNTIDLIDKVITALTPAQAAKAQTLGDFVTEAQPSPSSAA